MRDAKDERVCFYLYTFDTPASFLLPAKRHACQKRCPLALVPEAPTPTPIHVVSSYFIHAMIVSVTRSFRFLTSIRTLKAVILAVILPPFPSLYP